MAHPIEDLPGKQSGIPAVLKAFHQQLSALPTENLVELLSGLDPEALKAALERGQGAGGHFNKRKHVRRRLLKGGKILFNSRSSSVDCHIKDFSEGGCRIRLLNPMLLPRSFELEIQGEPVTYQCEVRWRSTSELGIQFLGKSDG